MKKLYSLLKACMTSDMNLFKVKTKKNNKSSRYIPIFIGIYLMFIIWSNSNLLFEKVSPLNMEYILLSVFAFGISIMTLIEGIYKTSSLIFNCKDDDLLLSLPIKRRTVLFIRIFKFYIFELLFNSLFLLPIMISYIRWVNIDWTYYLTSFVMIFMLPIIPIVISCIIGVITSNLSSRFKYKNASQIILTMTILILLLFASFNMEKIMDYFLKNATSINDLIMKIYYPAGIYTKLVMDFNFIDLIVFIVINLGIFVLSIYVLSKFYFKINSRVKKVSVSKKVNIDSLIIKRNNKIISLVKKELNTFFKTPVFIVNSGFALVLFLIIVIAIIFKFDSVITIISNQNLGISKKIIMNNLSVFIFLLITITSYMTSITNSVISLEGRNINILKSLPIKTKTILMSKIYSCLVITTPILFIGNIILFIKFKVSILEEILLLLLSVLIPLVSHFIGIIINLKYPKLDAENTAEVVKQSTSSLVAVMIGMILILITFAIIIKIIGSINSLILLFIITLTYILLDSLLYLYLINKGVKEFNKLSI